MRRVLLFLVWGVVCSTQAQVLIKGQLIDSLSQKGVEFANIGLLGKGYGTVSDENGRYEFTVPDSLINEQIKISIIGYSPKSFAVATLTRMATVRLQQSSTNLGEVTVTAAKTKVKILGNETRSKAVSGGFVKNNLGAEMAVKLNIKQPQTQIRKVAFNINRNTLGKQPIFRLNLYNADKNGMPGDNILKQNIIIEPKDTVGLVEVDLKPYAVLVDDDVFISIEWIKDLGDVKGLYFSTKLASGNTYYRLISQDKWQKRSGVGIGLFAEVAY